MGGALIKKTTKPKFIFDFPCIHPSHMEKASREFDHNWTNAVYNSRKKIFPIFIKYYVPKSFHSWISILPTCETFSILVDNSLMDFVYDHKQYVRACLIRNLAGYIEYDRFNTR